MKTEQRQQHPDPEVDQHGRLIAAESQYDKACILDSETAWVPAKLFLAATFILGPLLLALDILEI